MWKVFYFPGPGNRRVWRPIFRGNEAAAKARYCAEQVRRKRGHVFLIGPDGKLVRYGQARPA
jgi:hypothetical protein